MKKLTTRGLLLTAVLTATSAALVPAGTVLAHHGWSTFDTRLAYYIRGEITDVRWGNPHSIVTISVDETELPDGFRDRSLPAQAREEDATATLASARPYEGGHSELRLTMAEPSWMTRWGLDRPLEVGETLEVVGYLGSANDQDLRAVMFWLADGTAIYQQLTSFPTRPEPAN
ncbi:DUF6152 family protein [Poseidonocella sp. HB161398]|uniref:DUF6152 family protein n=1 Tax=Poseidonocella sp. HB161398 TaxID=2320855 RepID=UPI0011082337|nr:DUF6152 family protein [Poseidonocella sp. HB161398]